MDRVLQELGVFVDLTEKITSNLDLSGVLQAVTDAGTTLSGAAFGAFFYNTVDEEGRHYRLVALSGADPDDFDGVPAPHVTRLFAPTFAGEKTVRIDDITTHPDVQGVPAGHVPLRSYLATPVMGSEGDVIGALLFGHPLPAMFTPRSEDIVRLVATQASVAVANARLFEAEQAARQAAEQAAEGLAALQELTALLAECETDSDAVRVVTDTLKSTIRAGRVGVYRPNHGTYRAAAPSGSPPQSLPQHQVVPDDRANPISEAATTGTPAVFANREQLAAEFPEFAARIAGVEAAVALPLTVAGTRFGVLTLAWSQPHTFTDAEISLLTAAADQLAATLDRARLRAAEQAAEQALAASAQEAIVVSRTLQRSLLPQHLPDLDGLEVAVRYLPGAEHVDVGGDWFDVVPIADDRAVLVVGDVQGHSIGAAGVMGQLRMALHAYLAEGHPLHVALARANKLLETLNPDILATCCLAAVDPRTGGVEIARAGHPLPVLLTAAGDVTELDTPTGVPLGVLTDPEWPTSRHQLHPGDRLLLYTDGLIERSGSDLGAGVQELLGVLRGNHPLGEDGPETEVDALLDSVEIEPDDDIAVLLCRYTAHPAPQPRARLEVRHLDEVAKARDLVRRTLTSWDLDRLEDTTTLLVSEMVTNALLHADGEATLELRRTEDSVRILVSDTAAQSPRPLAVDATSTSGRGMMLVDMLAADWGTEPSGTGKLVWADVA